MSEEETTEIVKVGGKPERTAKMKMVKQDQMEVGGREGKKHRIELANPRHSPHREDVADTLGFVSREYGSKYEAMKIVGVYNQLRKKGYPVPSTTRYYHKRNNHYILMTDMTERGSFQIWGHSDYMSNEQLQTLESMDLDEDKIEQIRQQIGLMVDKAVTDGYRLLHYNYHIRKLVDGENYDLFLLDVDESNIKYQDVPKSDTRYVNEGEAELFIKLIKMALSS